MKSVKLSDITGSLSEYARQGLRETVVVNPQRKTAGRRHAPHQARRLGERFPGHESQVHRDHRAVTRQRSRAGSDPFGGGSPKVRSERADVRAASSPIAGPGRDQNPGFDRCSRRRVACPWRQKPRADRTLLHHHRRASGTPGVAHREPIRQASPLPHRGCYGEPGGPDGRQ
jgi:hypothetical protein